MLISLDSLGAVWKENKSDEIITSIFLLSIQEAKRIVKFNKHLSSVNLPDGFYTEAALELVSKLKIEDQEKNLSTLLNNICVANAKKYDSLKIIKYLNEHSYEMKIDSKLYLEDIIKQIDKYSIKTKSVILYCLCFGDIKLLPKLKRLFEEIEFSILLDGVLNIKNKIDNTSYNFDKYLPSTPLGRMMLVLNLMNKYPELSVFLILLKDFKKFLQFVIVNQGRNFKVPAISNITYDIIEISKSVNNMELKEVNKENIFSLKGIVFSDMELVSSLHEFIGQTMQTTAELYEKLSDKVLSKNNYSVDELKKMYEFVQKRTRSEINIMKSAHAIAKDFINKKTEGGQ